MNATDFKEKVLLLNINKTEIRRIKNITTKQLFYILKNKTTFTEISEKNYRQVWFQVNKQLAKEERFHRKQTHDMRNSGGYEDFGHLAYNGVADDF